MVHWSVNFEQSAYELSVLNGEEIVYSCTESSNANSGIIEDIIIKPGQEYRVELLVYGEKGKVEKLTRSFRSGNLGLFKGKWIFNGQSLTNEADYYQPSRNPVFRKVLHLDQPADDAIIHIAGLGYYNLYVNGVRVNDSELNTDWSNYDKTVFYDTYDVKEYLICGRNELFVELGNGWYNPAPLTLFGKYNLRNTLPVGEPRLLADVALKTDGQWLTVATDSSWEVAEGPYLFNNIYLGESVDFRLLAGEQSELAFKDTQWRPAVITTGPQGKLTPSYIPKIRQTRTIEPVEILTAEPDRVIVDFGETIAGFIDITFQGKQDQQLEFLYSEEINEDLSLNTDSTLAGFVGKQVKPDFKVPGGVGAPEVAEQKDRCICRDGEVRFVNKFTFHSFRYVQIKGLDRSQITSLQAKHVHTDLAEVGSFSCSDNYLNSLHRIAAVTKQNNVHSVFGDCARERLAYGGDIVALAKSQVCMFDTAALYEKTIKDFINDVREHGGMPETAPFMGIQSKGTGEGAGPLGWQLVFPYLLKTHYQYYGNAALIKSVYPYLERHVAYLNSLEPELIAKSCLGDWGSVNRAGDDYKNSSPAIDFTATCFYYFHLLIIEELSAAIGEDEKYIRYQNQAQQVKAEIVRRFRNEDGSFADRSQTSYVFAIYFELSDDIPALVQTLAELIASNDYQITCGIFGQSFAYEVLRKYEQNEVIYKWLYCHSGIRSMLSDNNLALKEFFGDNANGSCNHAMFSSYVSWFYQGLGGIQISDDAVGADKVIIKPYFAENISHVNCIYHSTQGMISTRWERTEYGIAFKAEVPFNLKHCTLVLDKVFEPLVSELNVTSMDKNNIFIDITDNKVLNITLSTDVLEK